jgi:hypothetical protein
VDKMRDRVRGSTVHDLVLNYCVKGVDKLGHAALLLRRQLHGYVARLLNTVTGSKTCHHMEEI